MNTEHNVLRGLCRVGVQLAIVACGVVAIWGSGDVGLGGFPDWSPGGGWYPGGPSPTLVVEPTRATASVGGSVEFRARATYASQPSYQWCRAPGGGGTCVDIPGATGDTYTVAGVNLADDGARYVVTLVSGQNVISRSAYLSVSSMPGVVFQESEFAPVDWSVTARLSPSENGPAYTATQSSTGGNPGAYMMVRYVLPPQSSVRLIHHALTAAYDPAIQGAIYTIDFTEDCVGTEGQASPYTVPMLQQGGRTYRAGGYERSCSSSAWETVAVRPSLRSTDFDLIDGPDCGAGESCPDFSAIGTPLAFGLVTEPRAYQTGAPVHGFDNWRVTIWRR